MQMIGVNGNSIWYRGGLVHLRHGREETQGDRNLVFCQNLTQSSCPLVFNIHAVVDEKDEVIIYSYVKSINTKM